MMSKNIVALFKNSITPLQYNILKLLDKHEALTRKQMVEMLITPRTTIYDNLVKLEKKKYVEKFSRKENNTKGRALVYWKINNIKKLENV